MKILALSVSALMGIAAACPAQASSFQFFEGNNCTQKALGAIDQDRMNGGARSYLLRAGNQSFLSTGTWHGWNDEARSVRITSNWRTVSEPRRMVLTLFDSPGEKKDDDWARIVVSDATLIPAEGVCVGSFERPFGRNGISIERHPDNGLDGKVSVIYLDCNSACRADMTAVPETRRRVIFRRRR